MKMLNVDQLKFSKGSQIFYEADLQTPSYKKLIIKGIYKNSMKQVVLGGLRLHLIKNYTRVLHLRLQKHKKLQLFIHQVSR